MKIHFGLNGQLLDNSVYYTCRIIVCFC